MSGWPRRARHGALLGALSFTGLVLVQRLAALCAGQLWTLDGPWLGLVLYPLIGALVGALVAVVAEGLRRVLAPAVAPLCVTLASLCLLPAAGRLAASAALRARQSFPGGRAGVLAAVLLSVVLAVVGMVRWLERRRRSGRERAALLEDAQAVGLSALLAVLLVHLHLLADKHAAAAAGRLGASALIWLLGAGLAGAVLAGLARGPLAGRPTGSRAVARLSAVVTCVTFAVGLWALTPATTGRTADASAPTGATAAAVGSRPNVLLVVLDTLRRDAVSAYGVVDDTTPALDALAARGVRWSDALANGCWTVPSHASLFTGLEVTRHGAGFLQERLRARPAGADGPRHPTLAERLSRDGWDTAAFVANMHIAASHDFDRGFDRFEEVWRAGQGDFDVLAPALAAWFGLGTFDKGGALLTRGVEAFLDERASAEGPWFLFVNLLEAHAPYTPPAPYDRMFRRDGEPSPAAAELLGRPLAHVHRAGVEPAVADELWRAYLGGVRYQDALLQRILQRLDASGRAEDTLVVVTSDHGENFGWQGLLGHGQDLNPELLAVPLIAAGPGLPRGLVDPTPCSLVDVMPSLLDWLDLAPEAELAHGTARVLRPSHHAPPGGAERPRLVEKLAGFELDPAEFVQRVAAVTPGGAELRWGVARHGLVWGDALYVRAAAPAVERRLSLRAGEAAGPRDDGWRVADDAEQAAALERRLDGLLAGLRPARRDLSGVERDADTLQQLRALGYVAGDGAAASGEGGHGDDAPVGTAAGGRVDEQDDPR